MSFHVQRYSIMRGIVDVTDQDRDERHAVFEDCVGIDRKYLSFPNVSSCLVCICSCDGAILGLHLTRVTSASGLQALAAQADYLRRGRAISRCYVVGPVKEWQGGTWPLVDKDQTVIRRLTTAMGWPPTQPVIVVDQYLACAEPVAYYEARQRAPGDVTLLVRPDRDESSALERVPDNAFLSA